MQIELNRHHFVCGGLGVCRKEDKAMRKEEKGKESLERVEGGCDIVK